MGMQFTYTDLKYQADAVKAVTDVFSGQTGAGTFAYVCDPGVLPRRVDEGLAGGELVHVPTTQEQEEENERSLNGYRNAPIQLSDDQLLENLQNVQRSRGIRESKELARDINKKLPKSEREKACRVELDITMETGTGKTYVYTKTMLELHKLYGWSKFIIVVPSVAIREGVRQSLASTEAHFFERYHQHIHAFIYDSSNLTRLDQFSTSPDIQVMIINMQAFNTNAFRDTQNANAKQKAARIMYSERDDFGSRRPIDVISANNPIVIEDEPQKMGGNPTRAAIARFKPLFVLNYSATHHIHHDCVYQLDTLDAYNLRLVKRIEVDGVELTNRNGTDAYLSLDGFRLSKDAAPKAVIEFEAMGASQSIQRRTGRFSEGDSIYDESGPTRLEAYKGFQLSEVHPDPEGENGWVKFLNGVTLHEGEVYGNGDSEAVLQQLRRVQIRETIKAHLRKEQSLFRRNIKCLSLFFIDHVSNYRRYGEDGDPELGPYGRIFEEEYKNAVEDVLNSKDVSDDYADYLRRYPASEVHRGYFSIDKKGHATDPKSKGESTDESAYDLILKDKARLLSFDEPTRFIFSHSALSEGWDNPNVFQICTLKESDSETKKHQEIGRGLRLCVNASGTRQDAAVLGEGLVQKVNLLTVIASESYENFTRALQSEVEPTLHERPSLIDEHFFSRMPPINIGGTTIGFTEQESRRLHNVLVREDFVDDSDHLTEHFRKSGPSAVEGQLSKAVEDDENLKKKIPAVTHLLATVNDPSAFKRLVSNARGKYVNNRFNKENFDKPEFTYLWRRIRTKHAYILDFSDGELEDTAVREIDSNLHVSRLSYSVSRGTQKGKLSEEDFRNKDGFVSERDGSYQRTLPYEAKHVSYDLLGEISQAAKITRASAARILQGIRPDTFNQFKQNPEEFIARVSTLIKGAKQELIAGSIQYYALGTKYSSHDVFEDEPDHRVDDGGLQPVLSKKGVQSYVFPDSEGEQKLANELENSSDVIVYAKIPRSLKIPTPAGEYSPDWAIAFRKGGDIQHVYFVAEQKGTTDINDLRGDEKVKIGSVRKLFEQMNKKLLTENPHAQPIAFDLIQDYQTLIDRAEGKAVERQSAD